MKNVLLIIVDSMSSTYYKDENLDVMPFLTKLKQKSVNYENVYSQAPYTEAATMNLYCGQDVLSDNGYMRRFKCADKTIFEAFKENGYTTYFNSLQPQCYPSSLSRGVDYLGYSVGYEPNVLWHYRLKHFSELYKRSELTDEDYALIEDILQDNFNEWLLFVQRIKEHDRSVELVENNAGSYDADEAEKVILSEKESFYANKKEYIDELLSKGLDSKVFSIPAFEQDAKVKDKLFISEVRKRWGKTFKSIKKKHRRYNKHYFFLATRMALKSFGHFLSHPGGTSFKELLKTAFTVYDAIFDFDLRDRLSDTYPSFKNAPSMYSHFNNYLSWLDNYDGKEPYFACIHIDDIHNPEIFFTYDTVDSGLNISEFEDVNDVLSKLPHNFRGSITHQLSLRYADSKLKYLYEALEQRGQLKDTVFAVTADHGFSFSASPLRSSTILNFYLENYKIPLVIYDGERSDNFGGLFSSKDIPSILLSMLNLQIPSGFNGKRFSDVGNSVLRIQYCGGGCPDIARRELFLAAFDENYFVSTKIKLSETVRSERLFEIYDLRNDKYQKRNLINGKCVRQETIQYLIDDLNRQLFNIRQTKKEFIQ